MNVARLLSHICLMPKIAGKRKLKGQLVFEFMIAVVIFFGVMFYVLSYLNGTVTTYSADYSSESMESRASQIGEMLVMNRGIWSSGNPVVMGLAEEWPVLNFTKISWLNSSCNNDYAGFSTKLDVPPGKRLKIKVVNETDKSVMADCRWGQPISGNVTKAETRRYAVLNTSDVVSVYVCIWSTGK